MSTFSDTPGYGSFWDIYNRGAEMNYHFVNHTGDWGNPAMLHFRVTPYIGLAYYDTDNTNGIFYDNLSPVANFTSSPTGTYPNMYDSSGNEIGNFVPAQPFTLTGAGIPTYWNTVELKVLSIDHCHVNSGIINMYNPAGVFFDITAPPMPYSPSTVQERDLLAEYGKVFFYRWEALNLITSAVVHSGYIMPFTDTTNTAYWTNTGVTASLPTGGVANLYYNTGNPSNEVVLARGTYPPDYNFSYTNTINGQTKRYKVEVKTFIRGTGDIISTLKLSIQP